MGGEVCGRCGIGGLRTTTGSISGADWGDLAIAPTPRIRTSCARSPSMGATESTFVIWAGNPLVGKLPQRQGNGELAAIWLNRQALNIFIGTNHDHSGTLT